MRDFNNNGKINVSGDFNVTDNSHNQEHKLLIHCSNEELLQERPFRQENIWLEQERKVKRLKPFYALSVILFVTAAVWANLNGKTDLASLIMGAASLFIGFQSLKATFEQNAFQREEQNVVNEIGEILKQRRVE
nr:hypothetical protein [uncultured Desulfuromonas sp.]